MLGSLVPASLHATECNPIAQGANVVDSAHLVHMNLYTAAPIVNPANQTADHPVQYPGPVPVTNTNNSNNSGTNAAVSPAAGAGPRAPEA